MHIRTGNNLLSKDLLLAVIFNYIHNERKNLGLIANRDYCTVDSSTKTTIMSNNIIKSPTY